MNNFYLPLILLSVFTYAASGTCEVLGRIGENKTTMRNVVGFISTVGLAVWPLWIAALFVSVKWWHVPILFVLSVFAVNLFDWLILFVAIVGDKASRIWLYLSSFMVLPLFVWTVWEMLIAYRCTE